MRGPVAPLSARLNGSSYPHPTSRPACTSGAKPAWLQVRGAANGTGRRPVTAPTKGVLSQRAVCADQRRAERELLEREQLMQLCKEPSRQVAGNTGSLGVPERTMTPLTWKSAAPLKSLKIGNASDTNMDEAASAHLPYRWTPVQRWQHGFAEGKYFLGTFVNTLSLNLQADDLTWHDMEIPMDAPRPRQAPSCCHLGEGMILCSGMVRTTRRHDLDPMVQTGNNGYLARLPEGMRPVTALPFAALGQEMSAKASHPGPEPLLVMIVVSMDGWIRCLSEHATNFSVDLSALRFSQARGVAISDEVRLHTCELASGRIVMLQGSLAERSFPVHSHSHHHSPLAQLPPACRPPSELQFIVVGSRTGSHQLVTVVPSHAYGLGADVIWSDSVLDHDVINLTGIMYKVAPHAQQHLIGGPDWSCNRKKIVVFEFQKILLKQYGTFKAAWDQAFDKEYIGHINFTKFGLGCKAAGYNGNLFRLWRMLDEDGSGEITLHELGMDCGKLECSVLPVLCR